MANPQLSPFAERVGHSPQMTGRAVAALAGDPAIIDKTGQSIDVRDVALAYGFTDLDGTLPPPRWACFIDRRSRPAAQTQATSRPPRDPGRVLVVLDRPVLLELIRLKSVWRRRSTGCVRAQMIDSINWSRRCSIWAVVVTDDRHAAAERIAARTSRPGDDILESPYYLIGTVDAIVDKLPEQRDRHCISCISEFPSDTKTFAPVVARLAGK